MLRRVHLAVTILLGLLLVVSLAVGAWGVARARRQQQLALEMEMVARQHAEQAAQAERDARRAAEKAGDAPVAPKGESK